MSLFLGGSLASCWQGLLSLLFREYQRSPIWSSTDKLSRLTIAPSLVSCVVVLSLRQYVGRSVASHPPNPVQPLRSLRSLQPGVLFSQGCGAVVVLRCCRTAAVLWCCAAAAALAAVVPWCCGVVVRCCRGGGSGVVVVREKELPHLLLILLIQRVLFFQK